MDVKYTNLYKPLIEKEERISKNLIRPRNLYRISLYQYSDGVTRSLSGIDSSLFFVTGIFERKIHGIKISEMKPEYFFEWFKKIMDMDKRKEESIDEMKKLEDLVIVADRGGQRLYDGYIKPSPILKRFGSPFRSYNIDGLRYIQEVQFKKNILKENIL
jgi:hypothetical protein